MKLAINYSPQAADLLSKGLIEIDYFKCAGLPDLVEKASTYTQVVVHLNLDAGPGEVKDMEWDAITELINQTKTPYVNLHLAPYLSDFPDIPPADPSQAQAARVIDCMLEDLQVVTDLFGPERVIVENVLYRGSDGSTIRTGVEPEVISDIVQETGCGFLLDISHARIAAHYLGMDERDYMNGLPCHRLQELHFTGLHQVDGRLVDHLPVLEADWLILEWVIERIRWGEWAHPWLMTLEYGGVGEKYAHRSDPEVIAEQVPRLQEIICRMEETA